jgi:hypothetical protein
MSTMAAFGLFAGHRRATSDTRFCVNPASRHSSILLQRLLQVPRRIEYKANIARTLPARA